MYIEKRPRRDHLHSKHDEVLEWQADEVQSLWWMMKRKKVAGIDVVAVVLASMPCRLRQIVFVLRGEVDVRKSIQDRLAHLDRYCSNSSKNMCLELSIRYVD